MIFLNSKAWLEKLVFWTVLLASFSGTIYWNGRKTNGCDEGQIKEQVVVKSAGSDHEQTREAWAGLVNGDKQFVFNERSNSIESFQIALDPRESHFEKDSVVTVEEDSAVVLDASPSLLVETGKSNACVSPVDPIWRKSEKGQLSFPVVYHWRGKQVNDMGDWDITLTTQLGLNRLDRLTAITKRWNGPLSAAILVCTTEDVKTIERWFENFRIQERMFVDKLTIHLVFGPNSPYPVNLMRNVAREGASKDSPFELIVDVDALLGGDMDAFSKQLRHAVLDRGFSGRDGKGAGVVFCLASFELFGQRSKLLDQSLYPESLESLKALFNEGKARPMHEGRRSYSGPFRHVEWIHGSEPYSIRYEVMFEPYFIMRREADLEGFSLRWNFPEIFVGRGFNKQAFHFELFCAGFEYVVLVGECFTVDIPHESDQWSFTTVGLEENKPHFYAFREEVAKRYGVQCTKEDWDRCDRRGVGCHRVCQDRVSSGTGVDGRSIGVADHKHVQRSAKLKEMQASREAAREEASRSREAIYWKLYLETLRDRSVAGQRKNIADDNHPLCARNKDGLPIVDVVFTWVNGSEAKHRNTQQEVIPSEEFERKLDLGGKKRVPVGQLEFRFRDFGKASTLKYSLRSLRRHAPWINRVWIVTADQKPSFLADEELNSKDGLVRLVSHTDIFSNPREQLPTVNSCAIESQLHRIPGLAECYIYLNDDFLLSKELRFSDLVDMTEDGSERPKVFFSGERAPRTGRDPWQKKIVNVANEMRDRLNLRFEHMYMVGHHGYFFVKRLVEKVVDGEMKAAFQRTSQEKWRTPYSVWLPFVYSNYLAWNYDVPVETESSFYFALTVDGGSDAIKNAFSKMKEGDFRWICINDLATSFPPEIEQALFFELEMMFPEPCLFETLI